MHQVVFRFIYSQNNARPLLQYARASICMGDDDQLKDGAVMPKGKNESKSGLNAYILLDRSGSMWSRWSGALSSVNAYVSELAKDPAKVINHFTVVLASGRQKARAGSRATAPV
jgi:hypothetical protein